MKLFLRAGVISAALVSFGLASMPATAGGLYQRSHASMKDYGYVPPRPAAGPCYVRADVGYAFANSPNTKWPVSTIDRTTDVNGNVTAETYTYIGDDVSSATFDDNWFGEVGIGCGQGSKGFRLELVYGYRGKQKFRGIPQEFVVTTNGNPQDVDDPMHTSLQTHTLMFHLYRDLGKWGRFVPYVGIGIGIAYHQLDEVYFTENPFLVNRIRGNNDIAFAWSVNVGAAYQLTQNAVLDLGYRYIDLGSITSDRIDSAGYANPAVKFDDLTAHELKIGVRYHFGGRQTVSYKPMK